MSKREKKMPKSVTPPPAAQEKLRNLFQQAVIAQQNLQVYAEGLSQGLGLDIKENWTLNVRTLTFERADTPPEPSTLEA